MHNQWQIKYFKDGKRTGFTFPAGDLSDAIKVWNQHTKNLINVDQIFSITNNHVLLHCDRCVKYPPVNDMLGDGFCKRHNYRFYMGNIKNPCPKCAIEEGLCHSCGEKIYK